MLPNQKTSANNSSNQNNIKNGMKTSPKPASNPLQSLEKEITQVVSACKSIVKDENHTKEKKGPRSKVTLETVAVDMSNILNALKYNLNVFKEKKDSFSDVLSNLEKSFETQIIQNRNENTNNRSVGQAATVNNRCNSAVTTSGTAKNMGQCKKENITNKNGVGQAATVKNRCQSAVIPSGTAKKCDITKPGVEKDSSSMERKNTIPTKTSSLKTSTSPKTSAKPTSNTIPRTTAKEKDASSIKQGNTVPKTSSFSKKSASIKTTVRPSTVPKVAKDEIHQDPKEKQNLNTRNMSSIKNSGENGTRAVVKNLKPAERRGTATEPKTLPLPKSTSASSKCPSHASDMSCIKNRSNISNQSNLKKEIRPTQIDIVKNMSNNPYTPLKEEVERAIRENKTFTIRGRFPAIRRALLRRGWVEKIHFAVRDQMNSDIKKFRSYSIPELLHLVQNKDIADLCKRLIKSKLLENHQVDLYYGNNYESYKECPDRVKQTWINRIRWISASYTSKQGLSEAARKSFWFHIPGVSNLNHPRSYKLAKNGETGEFIKDFNLTAAMSLLKWVKMNHQTGQCKILSSSGKIPLTVFDFAVNECYKFIKKEKHEDIDNEISEAMSKEWNDFLEHYYRTVHVGNHFKLTEDVTVTDLVRKATFLLERLKDHWPYLEMDGLMNIWILKPINSSRGIGIHMCRTLKYVLDVVKANPNRRYVIQKYVERPMLIYNTKFDIRQWFLISSCVPLTIWIYRQCYLRFSSQTYNLRKLHESIHLTNNSVQCRYSRVTSKDITLPSYNMWDSNQLKNYLSNIGFPKAFEDIIYPGMKECITAAVLMHEESIDRRRNTFELYGADFIVTEDFKPWLLEINSNPALYASTPITARMCPLVLEDVIKVVVDYQKDGKKNTGGFELLYQQKTTSIHKIEKLQVEGTHLKDDYFSNPPIVSEKNSSNIEDTKVKKLEPVTCIRELGIGMRNTLQNLLVILKDERLRRLKRRNISIETLLPNSSNQTQTSLLSIQTIKG